MDEFQGIQIFFFFLSNLRQEIKQSGQEQVVNKVLLEHSHDASCRTALERQWEG